MQDCVRVGESEKAVFVQFDGRKLSFGKSIVKDNVIPQWAVKQKIGLDEALRVVDDGVKENSNGNNNEGEDDRKSSPEMLVEHIHRKPEVKVTITRGQKGTYGWKICKYGTSSDEILNEVYEIDEALKKAYGSQEQ